MNPKILICIPVHNRLNIASLCIPTVRDGMILGRDALHIYDDGSIPPYEQNFFVTRNERFRRVAKATGIESQRREHFLDFARSEQDFTHLYLTDSDAIHDPQWREKGLELQRDCGGAPVCLYNTLAHCRLIGNTIEDRTDSNVIWRRVAPGISYLLTAEHVAKVIAALPMMPEHWNWDWTVPGLLGNRFAVSVVSYVDHIGLGGMHHPVDGGLEGGDTALNPTMWLVAKRAEFVAKIRYESQHPPS